MACRLQEVRPSAPSALAAPMAQSIALMAPTALGLFGASSHVPFHADGGQKSMAVTECSGQTPQRRRNLPWSGRTVEQDSRTGRCTAELGRTWIKAAPLRSAALAPGCGPGGPTRRGAPGSERASTDRIGSSAALTSRGGAPSSSACQCPSRGYRVKGACGVARDRDATLDPLTAHQGFGAYEEDGRRSRNRSREGLGRQASGAPGEGRVRQP
jgi:hypothetical protein